MLPLLNQKPYSRIDCYTRQYNWWDEHLSKQRSSPLHNDRMWPSCLHGCHLGQLHSTRTLFLHAHSSSPLLCDWSKLCHSGHTWLHVPPSGSFFDTLHTLCLLLLQCSNNLSFISQSLFTQNFLNPKITTLHKYRPSEKVVTLSLPLFKFRVFPKNKIRSILKLCQIY